MSTACLYREVDEEDQTEPEGTRPRIVTSGEATPIAEDFVLHSRTRDDA